MSVTRGNPGTQRVFQHPNGECILLVKSGEAVSFWVDENNRPHVIERLKGVDFKATGTQLKKDGWRCVGPGLEFSHLLSEVTLTK
jgi:hypothetical protein